MMIHHLPPPGRSTPPWQEEKFRAVNLYCRNIVDIVFKMGALIFPPLSRREKSAVWQTRWFKYLLNNHSNYPDSGSKPLAGKKNHFPTGDFQLPGI